MNNITKITVNKVVDYKSTKVQVIVFLFKFYILCQISFFLKKIKNQYINWKFLAIMSIKQLIMKIKVEKTMLIIIS